MVAPANEIQALIVATLTADAGVAALVGGRVFDKVPKGRDRLPFITFGPSDEVIDDEGCVTLSDHSLQIDIWSKYQGGYQESKAIAYAVRQALPDDLELTEHALIDLRIVAVRHLRDDDELKAHGVITIEVDIEEN